MGKFARYIGYSIAVRRLSVSASLARISAVVMTFLFMTGCFQITHIIDLKDSGGLEVRWVFKFSKALDQAQQSQQGDQKKGESLADMVDKQQKELPQNLKGLVKDLKVRKLESDFDAGMEVSMLVPNYESFPYEKIKKEDFPIIPRYEPSKKMLVFHFEPVKKPDQAKGDKKPTDKGSGGGSGSADATQEQEGADQMNAMGKQITQLFLSSVRYQIIFGKNLKAVRAVVRKGKDEKQIDMMNIGDVTIVDFPIFALIGEKEEPFDLVCYLK